MAESQVPYTYAHAEFDALTASLSPQRFATYLSKAAGNKHYAFALYLYNARLSKSLLFPLSVTEVTLRNAVDAALVAAHGQNWHQDDNFRTQVLNDQSLNALDRGFQRARSNDRGKVIAELTLDFWSNLFRIEYADLWRTKANIGFPGLGRGEGRAEIQALVKQINRLRNRVAHHEPILDMNIPDHQAKMIKLTKLRCLTTANWMRHHTTANVVMRSRPGPTGTAPETFVDRSDPNYQKVTAGESLFNICKANTKAFVAFICIDRDSVLGAFTHKQLTDYISDQALQLDGMIDLNDHAVSDLLGREEVNRGCLIIDASVAIADVVAALKRPRTRVVVGVEGQTGAPVGVILRAHRRY